MKTKENLKEWYENAIKDFDGNYSYSSFVLDGDYKVVIDWQDGYDERDLKNPNYIESEGFLANVSIRLNDNYMFDDESSYAVGDDVNGYEGGITISKNNVQGTVDYLWKEYEELLKEDSRNSE